MGIGRHTRSLVAVLRVLAENPTEEHYGLELAARSRISPGRVYPILIRLEAQGWLTGHWEEIDEVVEGRRRRRYYSLTELGYPQVARELVACGITSRQRRPGLRSACA